MEVPKIKISGTILIHLKPLRDVSISEIRNKIHYEDPEEIDTSLDFYFENMDKSILENSFNIKKYEEVRSLSTEYFEMDIGYSTKTIWELKIDFKKEDFHYLILKQSDDLIKSFAYLQTSLLRNKILFNLIKKSQVNDIIKKGNFEEILA